MRLQQFQTMPIEGVEGFGLLTLVAVMQATLGQNAIYIEHQQLDGFRSFQKGGWWVEVDGHQITLARIKSLLLRAPHKRLS